MYEGGFFFEALNTRLNKSATDTLNAGFKIKIQVLFDNEQVGTHLFYKDALRSVEHFGGENISYPSVTIDWLKRYKKHMLNLRRAYTIIGMYCRAIRTVINEVKRAGIIKENLP